MTETEFRRLLNKLDGYFIPRQIGSTAREWITAGSLLGETSIVDITLKRLDGTSCKGGWEGLK